MKNIIVKTKNDRVLYFYNDKGLCLKNLINTNTNPKMIFEDAIGDFDVAEISNGEVGIICQDKDGCIVFLRESGNEYLKSTLLVNKNKSVYDKHFNLFNHGRWLSVVYIVEYDGKKILSHHIIDKENDTPFAIDEIMDDNFFVCKDISENLILFYNKENEAGYRIYRWGSKKWGEYKKLTNGRIISFCDNFTGKTYFICEKEKSQFYLKAEYVNLEFTNINTIECKDVCEKAVMFFEDEVLWIIKENKDKLFSLKLNEDFSRLSGPMFFGNDEYKKLYRIKTEEKKYKIRNCYGYETNNIPKLIIYKNLYNTNVVIKERAIKDEGQEICEFAGINIKKESPEAIEINKLKLKVAELARRISRIENSINNS